MTQDIDYMFVLNKIYYSLQYFSIKFRVSIFIEVKFLFYFIDEASKFYLERCEENEGSTYLRETQYSPESK